jgi:MYXO-CTERM domain-containing protein
MDNHWNVGFILKGTKLLTDQNSGETPPLDVFSYWVLSDVFDESSGPSGSYILGKNSGNLPFGAVFGTMTAQGMRKAAFNAFKLLNYLGPKRLQSAGGSDNSGGINAMATTSDSGDSLQILLYNYNNTLSTASGAGDSQAISVSNLPAALAGKEVFVTQYVVDETHSNPYYVWEKTLNKPGSPSESEWQQMRAAQHLSVTTAKKTLTDATFSTTITMAKQSGTLIIVSVNRPLMGRDALVEIEGEDYDGQSSATKEDSGDSSSLGQSISFGSTGGNVFFRNVDFSDDGVSSVQLRVKSSADTTLELHQGTAAGTLLGKCTVSNTSGAWATQACTLSQAATGYSATDPLYVVVAGALHLNWMKFQAGTTPTPTGGTGAGGAGAGGATGTGAGGATTSKGGAGGNGAGGAAGSGAGGATSKGGAGGNGAGGAAGGGVGGATARGGSAGNGAGGSSAGVGGNGSDPVASGGDSGGGGTQSNSGGAGGSSGGSGGGSAGSTGAGSGAGASTSGCSCRIGSTGGPSGAVLLVGLAALVVGFRRNRTRRGR